MTTQTHTATAWGYGRASTGKQQITPATQEAMIRNWVNQNKGRSDRFPNGLEWGDFIFDQISAGTPLLKRPRGQELLLRTSPGDVVIFAKYTRAFRSASDSEISLSRFKEMGVHVIFLDLNIDTGTPNGALIASIMGAVAKHERDMIKERTKEGMDTIRSWGRPLGNWAPCGYSLRRQQNKWAWLWPNYTVRMIGDLALQLYRNGMTIRQIRNHITDQYLKGKLPKDASTYFHSAKKKKRTHIHRTTIQQWMTHSALGWPNVSQTEFVAAIGVYPVQKHVIDLPPKKLQEAKDLLRDTYPYAYLTDKQLLNIRDRGRYDRD